MIPTKDERERLKELRAKATPGPWAAADIDGQIVVERQACSQVVTRDGRQVAECFYVKNPPPGHGTPDVRLIVSAVNALPSLLAAIDELEADNAHLRSRLKNSTMPLTNEQQLIDALERLKEAEALLVASELQVNDSLAERIDAWLKQTESME